MDIMGNSLDLAREVLEHMTRRIEDVCLDLEPYRSDVDAVVLHVLTNCVPPVHRLDIPNGGIRALTPPDMAPAYRVERSTWTDHNGHTWPSYDVTEVHHAYTQRELLLADTARQRVADVFAAARDASCARLTAFAAFVIDGGTPYPTTEEVPR